MDNMLLGGLPSLLRCLGHARIWRMRLIRWCLRWPVLVAASAGLAVSGVIVAIALDHNPQEAFCTYTDTKESCVVQLGSVSTLALSWFVPAFSVALLLSIVGSRLATRLKTGRWT